MVGLQCHEAREPEFIVGTFETKNKSTVATSYAGVIPWSCGALAWKEIGCSTDLQDRPLVRLMGRERVEIIEKEEVQDRRL